MSELVKHAFILIKNTQKKKQKTRRPGNNSCKNMHIQ